MCWKNGKKIIGKIKEKICATVGRQILFLIVFICLVVGFLPMASQVKRDNVMSFIELIIEAIFCVLVWHEFKMTRKSFEWQERAEHEKRQEEATKQLKEIFRWFLLRIYYRVNNWMQKMYRIDEDIKAQNEDLGAYLELKHLSQLSEGCMGYSKGVHLRAQLKLKSIIWENFDPKNVKDYIDQKEEERKPIWNEYQEFCEKVRCNPFDVFLQFYKELSCPIYENEKQLLEKITDKKFCGIIQVEDFAWSSRGSLTQEKHRERVLRTINDFTEFRPEKVDLHHLDYKAIEMMYRKILGIYSI